MEKQYIAKFEKVSKEQFIKDISNNDYIRNGLGLTEEWLKSLDPETTLKNVFSLAERIIDTSGCHAITNLKLPKRATSGSAG